ncbi:MAG: S1/P1 nuclease [Gammaproteobacteria bacterium]|nr:S1/P1 nuclease [Gammaproteobacteria bacterium]
MKLSIKSLILGLGILLSFNSYSWNAVGHMVVANIAYQNLQPAVRTKVDAMVADLNKEYPYITHFSQLGPWPDALRSQRIESFTHWHYVDLAISGDGTPIKNIADTDNAIWAINKIEPVLKNVKANPYEHARFLAFLVHIVADIHQPLHTVARITAAYPSGDKGGNLYIIKYPAQNPHVMPLHKLWDEGFELFNNDTSTTHIDALTNQITAQYPIQYFGSKVTELTAADWAKEGVELAPALVYSTPENEVPSPMYITLGKQTAEQRAALAGYRLANLLNLLLA